jgi:hypothetical protein
MARCPDPSSFFNVPQARWVIGVLNMLVAVVGKDSLLGLVLRQTRSDIAGLVRRQERDSASACYRNN